MSCSAIMWSQHFIFAAMSDRIQQLLQFLQEDPEDAFTHYALALEYMKTDATKAKAAFDHLLEKFPAYLPTYYSAAHFFIELGLADRAEKLFIQGIDLSKAQNNNKARMELQSAYDMFMMDRE